MVEYFVTLLSIKGLLEWRGLNHFWHRAMKWVGPQLEKEFGSSRKFNGGSTLVGIATSIPVFWWSAHLLRTYGAWRMLRLAQILLLVRYFILALISFIISDCRLFLAYCAASLTVPVRNN